MQLTCIFLITNLLQTHAPMFTITAVTLILVCSFTGISLIIASLINTCTVQKEINTLTEMLPPHSDLYRLSLHLQTTASWFFPGRYGRLVRETDKQFLEPSKCLHSNNYHNADCKIMSSVSLPVLVHACLLYSRVDIVRCTRFMLEFRC